MSFGTQFFSHSSQVLYWLVIVGTVFAECVIAVWAATSTRPRLMRALVVWAAIVLLIPIRAYVPALVLTMTAALTFGLVAFISRWQKRQPPSAASRFGWRFQLADILILILFISTVIALGRYCGIADWRAYVLVPLLGLPLAPVMAFAYHSVAGPARRWMAVATFVAIVLSAAALQFGDVAQSLGIQIVNFVRRPERWQLALHTLLLAILAACIALSVWLAIRSAKSHGSRQRFAYAAILACSSAIGLLLAWFYADLVRVTADQDIVRELIWVVLHAVPLVVLALLVAGTTWLSRGDWGAGSKAWRRSWRSIAAALAAAILVPAAWLYWHMFRLPPFPPPPPGGTNYDRIVAIGREFDQVGGRFPSSSDPRHIQPLVDELVTLLAASNHVPASALEAEIQLPRSPRALTGRDVLGLNRCFSAAFEAAADQGDFDRGADCAIAAARLDATFRRGGTTWHSSYFRGSGLQWIADHRALVSPAKAREIIAVLEHLLAEREDLAVLLARDQAFAARSYNWQGRLAYILFEDRQQAHRVSSAEEAFLGWELSLRSIQTLLAIHLFQADHRRFPSDLAELTPEYLPDIPLDPHSGLPLVYRPRETTFDLYSVGRDGYDDGGNFDSGGYGQRFGSDLDLRWKTRW